MPPAYETASGRPLRAPPSEALPPARGPEERGARREVALLLFCAVFAAVIWYLWQLTRRTWFDGWAPEAVQSAENLKDFAGSFLAAYVAARLYYGTSRRYERQIERQRALLAHILDTSPDAIVTVDDQDRVTTWNRGATQIFGFSEAEIVGRHVSLLYPPDVEADRDIASIRTRVQQEGVLRDFDAVRMTRSGRRIRTEISTSLLRDARGSYAGRASIVRDVTERDRIREELSRKESLAVVGEMAAAIAHEIKNPLAGIGGAVGVIGRSIPRDDPRQEVITEIQRQVKRLDETIRDLLNFARPAVPRFGTIDVREFLGRILRALAEEPEVKRHSLETQIPPGFSVHADPQLLENILLNLLLNAGQALGDTPGRIQIRATMDASHARLAVIDSGPGIPDTVLPNIFKPFFTTKHRGTGLGLAIVKKLTEGMGGRVEVETKVGQGSAFTLVLPREAT